MADRRMRGAPVGLMSFPRPRKRFRPCNRSLDTTAVYIWYVVVVLLLVSAGLPRVLVTNSLLPLQSFIGHNYCIWYVVVVLLVSAALRSVLVTDSLLPLQSFIGHNCCIWYVVSCSFARDLYLRSVLATNSLWTQLLYMVRSCSSARECCST